MEDFGIIKTHCTGQCENIISCLSLGFILNMEQEETKGCSGVSIDAPDPGQGLCTISFAGVSQRANINVHCCCGWLQLLYSFRVESQRKRPRAAGDKSGAKRRGRPRKNEPALELSVTQEEAAAPEEAPAVVVVSEPAEVIPDQTTAAMEAPPVPVLAAPAPQPVFGSLQNPLFSPAPFISTPALFSPSVPAPAPAKDLDRAPIPLQDLAPAPAPDDVPVRTSTQAPDPAAAPAPPTAPSQVGALYVAAQGREAPNQVLIEDVGPDEDEDIPPSQDKRVDEGKKRGHLDFLEMLKHEP